MEVIANDKKMLSILQSVIHFMFSLNICDFTVIIAQ